MSTLHAPSTQWGSPRSPAAQALLLCGVGRQAKLQYTHVYIFDWVFSKHTLKAVAELLQRSPFYVMLSTRKCAEWWSYGLVKVQPVAKLTGFRTTGQEGMSLYVYINLEKARRTLVARFAAMSHGNSHPSRSYAALLCRCRRGHSEGRKSGV